MAKTTTILEMDLAGGAACLDFVNTALDEKVRVERLHNYDDLLILAGRTKLLSEELLGELAALASEVPDEALKILMKARQVRESMLEIFIGLATGKQDFSLRQMKTFNQNINEALSKRKFVFDSDKLSSRWAQPGKDLMQPVWSFCLSAYDLLVTKDQRMIKQCGGCPWVFIDETKNHRRKWCDMQTCGTNQKARRYYRRKKSAQAN